MGFRAVSYFFFLLAMVALLFPVAVALREIVGLYQGALDDPMGTPEASEQNPSARILEALRPAVFAVPLIVLGVGCRVLGMVFRSRRPPT